MAVKEVELDYGWDVDTYFSDGKIMWLLKNKYGVEYSLQSKLIKDKYYKTMVEKYGVSHPMKSNDLKNKIKSTLRQKYNVECPF
jgi:hypothetical protein